MAQDEDQHCLSSAARPQATQETDKHCDRQQKGPDDYGKPRDISSDLSQALSNCPLRMRVIWGEKQQHDE